MTGTRVLLELVVVLGTAAVVTVVFQALRLPVVLGYVAAGLLIGPHVPVPLVAATDARPGASHWFARDDDHWILRTTKSGALVDCWASTLEADNLIDFEVGNHYTATHPASPFVNRLLLRATTSEGYVAVMNRSVTLVDGGGARSSELADRAALRAMLNDHFGFDLPEVLSIRVPSIEEWR